jgi:ribosomal protein S27AE
MNNQEEDRIECAIRHIESALDVDPWARDIAVDAMEKRIPKKPGYTKLMYICNGEDIEFNHPECPYCRTHGLSLWDAAISVNDKYCKRCGQAIDWTEGE